MRASILTILFSGLFSICLCQVKPLQVTDKVDSSVTNIDHILKRVNESVNKINSGTYKLHDVYILLNVGEDTTVRKESISNYFFKKNTTDNSIGFNFARFDQSHETVFNGDYLYDNYNKTLTVTDMRKSAAQIDRLKSSISFMPFMNEANRMMQSYKTHNDPVALVGYEFVDGEKCFKIQLGNSTESSYIHYYVSTASYLPIKSSIILTHTTNNAIRIQTFHNWLTDLKINPELGDSNFSKNVLSTYNKEVEFADVKEEANQLLPLGTLAPDWELPTITNKTIKLSDLKGKIVIMDFWFKACIPCQQQMIDLEDLYKKVDKNKVIFISINTIDDPINDKLKLFSEKRKLTMPMVYNGKKIEPSYHAYSSPVLYVIDKNGKIAYTQDGYSDGMINNIKQVIKNN